RRRGVVRRAAGLLDGKVHAARRADVVTCVGLNRQRRRFRIVRDAVVGRVHREGGGALSRRNGEGVRHVSREQAVIVPLGGRATWGQRHEQARGRVARARQDEGGVVHTAFGHDRVRRGDRRRRQTV